MSAATGALGGFGSSLAKAMLFGAAANMINTAYQTAGSPCDRESKILRSGLYGAAGGAIGYSGGALGSSIFRPIDPIGQIVGQNPVTNYGAIGTAIGSSVGGIVGNQ